MRSPLPQSEAQQPLQAAVVAWQKELTAGLPEESLAALALVPMWTERLAAEPGVSILSRHKEFLRECEKRNLCVRGPQEDEQAWATRRARALMLLWRWMHTPWRERWFTRILKQVEQVSSEIEQLQYFIALSSTAGDLPVDRIRSSIERWPNEDVRARLWQAWAVESRGRHGFTEAWAASSTTIPAGEERARAQIALLSVANAGGIVAAEVAPPGAASEPGALVLVVRDSIGAIEDKEASAHALLALAKVAGEQFTEQFKADALEHVAAITDIEERTSALIAASASFSGDRRNEIVRRALEHTAEIPSPLARARVLFGIPQEGIGEERLRLAQRTLDEVMQSVEEGPQRDRALVLLVGTFAPIDVATANGIRRTIHDPAAQIDALAAVASADKKGTLSPVDVAVDAVSLIERTGRWECVGDFVSFIVPGLSALPAFVERIEAAVSDPRRCREALLSIASRVPSSFAEPILSKVLRGVVTIVEERDLLQAFAQIAPRLSDRLIDEACTLVLSMKSDRTFSMPDSLRPYVIGYLANQSTLGSRGLQRALVDLGKLISGVSAHRTLEVPVSTIRWARVAAVCDQKSEASTVLVDEIRKLVDSGELGAAMEWCTTGERIATIPGMELREAILLGRRGVEVASRRIMDARHLEKYLHRDEQGQAFQALLDDREHWALHYLGMGGIGKTMLLRQIMARLAVGKNGGRLAVARIDFDEMSPEFPVRQPATLLMGLAEDLRRSLPPGADDLFSKLRDEVVELHGALDRDISPENPLDSIRSDEFDRVVDKFVAMISLLPKPVVLILDTCEELAKLEPVGQSIPAVDATFEILEKLQAKPGVDVRVVFAGRRLLAQAGHKVNGQWGWQVREGTTKSRTTLLPMGKDYLRLHLIRGFTDSDVDRYLAMAGLSLDKRRKDAILGRSRETGVPADIDFAGSDPDAPAIARYNPFDISLYVDWVQADSNVLPEVLGSGERDPYVEMRIIRRIADLAPVIPGAVLLRRFDEEMLRPLLGNDDVVATRRFRDLAAQEWIDVREGLFQVDANLLERLEDYYLHHDARVLNDATDALAPALARLAQQHLEGVAPFDVQTTPLMDAALRLLPTDAAADLWDRFERRLTEVRNWDAAKRVCEFLLFERNGAGGDYSPIRPAVLATLIATRLHTSRDYVPTNDWAEVHRLIDAYPKGPRREWLAARADLGRFNLPLPDLDRLTKPGTGASSWIEGRTNHLDDWQIDQLRGSVCSLLEEMASTSTVGSGLPERRLVDTILAPSVPPVSPELQMFVRALDGLRVDWNPAGVSASTAQQWLDWRAPASIRDRSRLLQLLREGAVEQPEVRFAELAGEIDTIDAERLASQLLVLQLEEQPVPKQLLDRLESGNLYDEHRVPTCDVHRAVPPLFQSIGMAMLANGDGGAALALAGVMRDHAQQHHDNTSVTAAEQLRLNVVRRFRLSGAMAALERLVRVQHPNASDWHYRWALSYAASATEVRSLLDFADTAPHAVPGVSTPSPIPRARTPEPHEPLDFKEAAYLAKRIGNSRRFVNLDPPNDLTLSDVERGHLPFVIRAIVLHDDPMLAPEELDLRSPVERRRLLVANAMLEEGELLMLRVPDRALQLFAAAQNLYREVSPAGELIAGASAAIAAMKADRDSVARRMFNSLQRSYEYLQHLAPAELPPWGGSAEVISAFSGSVWYPWLLRIAAVRARLTEREGGPQAQKLQPLIQRHLGDDGHPDFSLEPFEVVTAPAAVVPAPRPASEAWRRAGVKVGRVATIVAMVLLVAAIVGAELYGVYRAGQWIQSHPDWYPDLVTISMLVGLVAVIPQAFRWFTRQLVRDGAVRIEISRSLDSAAASIAMRQQLRGLSRIGWLFGLKNSDWSEEYPAVGNKENGTSQRAPFGPLRILRRRLLMRPIVPLYIDELLARERWEQMLDLPLEAPGRRLVEPVAFIRAAPSRQSPAPPVQFGVGIVAGPDLPVDTLVGSWRRAEPTPPPIPDASAYAVIHLIGRPRRSRSGAVFVISGAEGTEPRAISVRDVHADWAQLLIVQEEPVQRLRRLDVDREQTSEARAWAAEAFNAGANAVILIPAMPSPLATQVVDALARVLRPDRGSAPNRARRGEPMFTPWRLAGAVSQARRRVARFAVPPATDGHADLRAGLSDAELIQVLNDLAMDITLFARSPYFSRRYPFTGFA